MTKWKDGVRAGLSGLHNGSGRDTLVLDHSDAGLGEATPDSRPGRYLRLRIIGADGYSGPWVSLTELQIIVAGPKPATQPSFSMAWPWGINHGHLDRAIFLPAEVDGWNWLAHTAVQRNPDGLLGYVQAIGDQPICSAESPLPGPNDSADFGVGALLLAAGELFILASTTVADSTLHLPLIRH